MPGAWTQNFYHLVFSTKHRTPTIGAEIEPRLYPFLTGIARNLKCEVLALNGMPDHVHFVLMYPGDLSHSDLVRHLKGRLSKWIHESMPELREFAWQEGYGGFTVSRSALEQVVEYVKRQKEHHRRMTFEEEFLAILEKHGMKPTPGDALG
ncbi:MAG: IS200/IS605 family transposase [Phycisphaeraceae bacterium]|nr:IS200/IS605 family transposase [Phycisphaeraceae bacterium]